MINQLRINRIVYYTKRDQITGEEIRRLPPAWHRIPPGALYFQSDNASPPVKVKDDQCFRLDQLSPRAKFYSTAVVDKQRLSS